MILSAMIEQRSAEYRRTVLNSVNAREFDPETKEAALVAVMLAADAYELGLYEGCKIMVDFETMMTRAKGSA